MVNAITNFPRAGTVEVIQEFAAAAATPALPILAPVVIGSAFQIEASTFAGYYSGSFTIGDEFVGTGNGTQTEFFLVNQPVLINTVALHLGTISGTELVQGTDYNVTSQGIITLTPGGVANVGTNQIHATYSYAPSHTYVYPNILEGAEVEDASLVTVELATTTDVFDITTGFGVTIGLTTITVPGNLTPSTAITQVNGQFLSNASISTIQDLSENFQALGVQAGDIVQLITDPSLLQRSNSIAATDASNHTILTVPNQNTITISPPIPSQGGLVEYQIIRLGAQTGSIQISYTARRSDLVGQFLSFNSTTDVANQLGPITEANPLAFGLATALGATDKMVFGMMVADQENLIDHQEALDILSGEEVYLLVPLTNNPAILQVYHQHCVDMSQPANMAERRVLGTVLGLNRIQYQSLSTTGQASLNSQVFTDPNGKFRANGVPIGAVIYLQSPAQIELENVLQTELIIASVVSDTQLILIEPVTHGTDITGEAVGTGTGAQLNFQLANTSNVVPASVIIFLNGVQQSQASYSVNSNGQIVFVLPPGNGVAITANYEIVPINGIQYIIESQQLTAFQIAQNIAAVGAGYDERHITLTYADTAVDANGVTVPTYFLNCAIAGLVSALPPNQPLANTPIPGFLSVGYIASFTDANFGLMAASGISVFMQDKTTSPVVMRNWLTTDMTSVDTRECSIVDMVDYYSKFLRTNVKAIAGKFNITPDFIDNMLRPAINGVNKQMITAGFIGTNSNIVSIEQSTVNKDQLFVLEEISFFAPANVIQITVRVL